MPNSPTYKRGITWGEITHWSQPLILTSNGTSYWIGLYSQLLIYFRPFIVDLLRYVRRISSILSVHITTMDFSVPPKKKQNPSMSGWFFDHVLIQKPLRPLVTSLQLALGDLLFQYTTAPFLNSVFRIAPRYLTNSLSFKCSKIFRFNVLTLQGAWHGGIGGRKHWVSLLSSKTVRVIIF